MRRLYLLPYYLHENLFLPWEKRMHRQGNHADCLGTKPTLPLHAAWMTTAALLRCQ